MKRFRVYLNQLTAQERTDAAEQIIEDLQSKLLSGWNPLLNTKVIFKNQLLYKRFAHVYGSYKSDDSLSISILLSEFLEAKKCEVNSRTFTTYQSRLRNFYNYLNYIHKSSSPLSHINSDIILSFLKHIVDKGDLSVRTILKYRQILYSFFEFFRKKNIIIENPVVDLPKLGYNIDNAPAALSNKHRKELIEIIKNEDYQLYIACSMMYYCAIRPGEELRNLKIKDINIDSLRITINAKFAKNGKQEAIDLPISLANILANELKVQSYNHNDYLFGKHGIPGPEMLSINSLRNRFNAIRDKYGYPTEYKLYSWKHTGAQALRDANVSTYAIQRHLRHKSIETTECYLRKRLGQNERKIIDNFPEI